MQSRLSAGRSPVECSHFAFHRNISLSHSHLTVRSFVYVAIILCWTSLFNPYSFVGRCYWPRNRSSCDHLLNEMINKREIHTTLPVGLCVCGWDIHPVLLASSCSWHAWPNVKLICNLFSPPIHFLPNRRIASQLSWYLSRLRLLGLPRWDLCSFLAS